MGARKKVLVVDDSATLLDALADGFDDAGYEVALAGDGEEVLRKLGALQPDAILVDVFLPRLNGAEVCRLVKAHPVWKKTWLVVMSSRMDERQMEELQRLGADDILRKPFDAAVAVAAVAKGIGPGEPR